MANAKRDDNYTPTVIGVSSVDGVTPTLVKVNPLTGAILIDGTSLYTSLDTRYVNLTGDTMTGKLVTTANTTTAGLLIGGFTTDPSSLVAGDIWRNTTSNFLKFRDAGGTTRVVVTQTQTQTLTNKTLTTPTIASFTNATHTHQNNTGGGTLDHGLALTGLTDDDHTQYVLLAGRSGGQTIVGDTASGGNLTLKSTSHATKGKIYFGASSSAYWDENAKLLYLKGADSTALAIKAVGFLQLQNTEDDATNTTGIMQVAHYTKAEEAMCAFFGTSTSTTGIVAFGGGSAAVNAATEMRFFTASNNTTLRGTMGVTMQPTGMGVGLTEDDSPTARLHLKEVNGSLISRLQGTAINTTDGANWEYIPMDKATTNATVTTLGALTVATNTTYLVEVRVVARRTGGTAGTADDGAVYIRRAMVTTKAGTVTINTIDTPMTQEDQAGWDLTLLASSTFVLVRATGAANNNISWSGFISYLRISS